MFHSECNAGTYACHKISRRLCRGVVSYNAGAAVGTGGSGSGSGAGSGAGTTS